jgi:hypothetical protein
VNPQQILPFAGQASTLVDPVAHNPVLRIQDCIGGQQGCATWDTATSAQCQVYIANWTDSSISLDVNLPYPTTDQYGMTESPLSDMSPLTFFPNPQNTTTQACPVAYNDALTLTVANAQGGGTAGPICVYVGHGSLPCPTH